MNKPSALWLIAILTVSVFVSLDTFSQAPQALPLQTFLTLRDSTTSMDVVFLTGAGGSISAEGKNVQSFNSFFENQPAPKTIAKPAGNIMWLINGREFISGSYFLGDSTGYVVFQKDGKEFVNLMNAQGNTFLKSQFK
jgi:hypothetical protein